MSEAFFVGKSWQDQARWTAAGLLILFAAHGLIMLTVGLVDEKAWWWLIGGSVAIAIVRGPTRRWCLLFMFFYIGGSFGLIYSIVTMIPSDRYFPTSVRTVAMFTAYLVVSYYLYRKAEMSRRSVSQ